MKDRELVFGEGTILEHGYGMVAKVPMTDRNLSATAKALYAYLCTYADSHNRAFPSIAKIKADLNLGKNTLHKYMRELREAGYITVSQSKDNCGKWSRNVYNIALIPQHTPYPKEWDTVKPDPMDASRENATFVQHTPCPQKRDTVKRDTVKRDTVIGDTKNTNDLKTPDDLKVPTQENKNNVPSETAPLATDDALTPTEFCQKVMDFYNEQFKGLWARPLRLTDDRRTKILARRKKYTLEELQRAIANIRTSPFHCGQNDNGRVYATPEFIFRNDSMVDKWLNMVNTRGDSQWQLGQEAMRIRQKLAELSGASPTEQ